MSKRDEVASRRGTGVLLRVGQTMTNPKPDFEAGVRYWEHTSADVDGVLGGYGEQES
jgi:hypothetical protein